MAQMLTGAPAGTYPQMIDEQVRGCVLEVVEREVTEGAEKVKKVYARGEFGHAAKPTANGRHYGHPVWESNISRLKDNLEQRKVIGELDHPTDGRTSLQRASHVITGLRLEGDRVMGEAEILNTAKGRDLRAILEAGVPVGISSRGYGSTKPNAKGVEEVQPDYKLVTFDFVAEPADDTAYPEVHFESAEGDGPPLFEGIGFDAEEPAESEPAAEEPPEVPSDVAALRDEFEEHIMAKLDDIVEGRAAPSTEVAEASAAEISELRSQVAMQQEQIDQQNELIETLTAAARTAGYRYHVERMISGDPSADEIRESVGDVLRFESAEALTEHVGELLEAAADRREQEERVHRRASANQSVLREKNQELAGGLEEAMIANRTLALENYARKRLQNHPRGAKIMRLLEKSGIQSTQQVDDLIEEMREPMMEVDDLEAVRDRVRQRLGGGREHLQEEAQPRGAAPGGAGNYNGLGMDLGHLRHLAGIDRQR